MATTYEPIATTTLGSAASSYTFSSIPATYTDLRLVMTLRSTGPYTGNTANFYFNGDNAGSTYSETWLKGNGTTASSSRSGGNPYFANTLNCPAASSASGLYSLAIIDVFSYAGSTYKTALSETSDDKNGSGDVFRSVHLWSNTSAITSISVGMNAGEQLAAGCSLTLYGIKKA